jgi:hypothetical protein
MKEERTMDGTNETPVCDSCRQIPLSHLALDIAEPLTGWLAFFEKRNIEGSQDVCGRPSIPRWVLTKLLDEQREREASRGGGA